MSPAAHCLAQNAMPIDQPRIGTYTTDGPFESYLGSLRSGDAVQFSANGKTYSGIYIGRKTLDGVEQHVAINVVEVSSSKSGNAIGNQGEVQGNTGANTAPNTGTGGIGNDAAIAAGGAAASHVVYRLFFVSPELEQRIAIAKQKLNVAAAETQAAVASYRLIVEGNYTQASSSLADLSQALSNTPIVVPSQLLKAFEDQPVRFSATDPAFNGQLTRTFYQLTNAQIVSPIHKEVRIAGIAALAEAEQLSLQGNAETARQFANTATEYAKYLRGAADLLVGIDPISGFARDTYELFSGTDLISGGSLTDVERALRAVSAGANLATLGTVPVVLGGVKIVQRVAARARPGTLSGVFTIVEDLPFTKHAMEQFTSRRLELLINSKTATELTPAWIKRTIDKGKSFWDHKHKTVAFFSKSESGKWLHVAVAKDGQPRITTIVVKDKFATDALWNGESRFIPYSEPLPNLIIK